MTKFDFRSIPATDKKYADTVAAFESAGIKYDVTTEKDPATQEDVVTSIKRASYEAELPVITVVELAEKNPDFVQKIVDGLVKTAASKLYVDKLQPVGEISIEQVIEANTPKQRASFSKELKEACASFVADNLRQRQVNDGTITMICELVKGMFTSGVCNKHQRASANFADILAACIGYVAGHEEAASAFGDLMQYMESNLTNWIEAQATQADSLDFSAL